jgi:DNA-binding GntR family transcriptional regulator
MSKFDQKWRNAASPSLASPAIPFGDRLRLDILAGSFPFGGRLKINELAEHYATSHMPVREALRQLQGEGLVNIEPNCGARVRTIDAEFVCDIFDLRMAIEPMLARRAASRISQPLLLEMTSIERSLEACAARHDYPGVLSANKAFHTVMNDAAGNKEAVRVLDRHWNIIVALWGQRGYGAERVAGVIADHCQILVALTHGDGEAAAILAAAHVAKAKQEMLSRFDVSDAVKGAA